MSLPIAYLIVATVLSLAAYISRALDAIERHLDRKAAESIAERYQRARGAR